ncbi:MAG: glutamine--fructose-6-phosphate transaminase (isomerizing) [Clostridia bacterium]|nr:glutamine--fructose-6-phosphate transaminase (isomerizing) [Clostridia bacterium]
MCGIYGVVGQNAINKTIAGIKRLEYRGYDSSGIAFFSSRANLVKNKEKLKKNCKKYIKNIKFSSQKLVLVREKGEIKNLENVFKSFCFASDVAIAHTRWATHGRVSIKNSHPHMSQDGRWAVVHNGIIENYNQLKNIIPQEWLQSETDSEVVAHLLQIFYKQNILECVCDVCSRLSGSFALAIICADEKDKIFVARKNSPLVVGYDENCGVVCSDLNSAGGLANVFVVDDSNLGFVEKGGLQLYNFALEKVEGEVIKVDQEENSTEGKTYPHFMLKEIEQIPAVIEKTADSQGDFIHLSTILDRDVFSKFQKFLIIGCGTAYHAGRVGGEVIERVCKKSCCCEIASEFCHKTFLYDLSTLAIFVSQSGETADTLKALRLCHEKGLKTLAITNVKNSTITREADYVLYCSAGAEIAVASTKAFNAQLCVFYIFAAYLKSLQEGKDYVSDEKLKLKGIAGVISQLEIDGVCKEIACQIKDSPSLYMIGRGMDYILALEASLKLKEISYIHSEAYPAGELKHGTLSLIEEGTFVFAFASSYETLSKNLSNIKEVQARGGKVIMLSPFEVDEDVYKQIKLESVDELYMPLYAVVYMQKIAYYTTCMLGHNPDKPRSLAKSVTVE